MVVPDPEPAPRRMPPAVPLSEPATAQGARRLTAVQGNVPAATDGLVGRQDELVELGQLVDAHRMVTVIGPPGVGKSRLALDVARQAGAGLLDNAWPDGVWLIDLAVLPAGDPVAPALAAALSLPAWCSTAAGLVEALRPRRALLLLDNVEHVLNGCAELIGALLKHCAGLRVLVTSRETAAAGDGRVTAAGTAGRHRPAGAGPGRRRGAAVRLSVPPRACRTWT